MHGVLNVSVLLVCAAIAGLSSLVQSAQSRAATLPASLAASGHFVAVAPHTLVMASSHRGGSIEAHFAAANTTHDGQLTQVQAEQVEWPLVVKHFDEIDTDHKGWISVDQIHAFNKS